MASAFAPAPDFRYVGLEPVAVPRLGVAATACGLGAGVTLAMSGLDSRQALVAGALATIMSAFALNGAAPPGPASGSVRMAIVPWGVLVETAEFPRILRWAAVRKVAVATTHPHRFLGAPVASRVIIETAHDRFVGEAVGAVRLERLVEHVEAYAIEQSTPLALDLEGLTAVDGLDTTEPALETLLGAARDWIETSGAVTRLSLEPGGYRRAGALAPTSEAVDLLRFVLGDRTPKAADPRAFAAVVAAEIHARELVPDLVALTQCPHPIVAAVARQAARKLGAPRARTGTLDEVAPFLFESDVSALHGYVMRRT